MFKSPPGRDQIQLGTWTLIQRLRKNAISTPWGAIRPPTISPLRGIYASDGRSFPQGLKSTEIGYECVLADHCGDTSEVLLANPRHKHPEPRKLLGTQLLINENLPRNSVSCLATWYLIAISMSTCLATIKGSIVKRILCEA